MVHTPGSHLLTTNQTQIISKTRTHRSQQSILLQLFFATQCYTSGSEIWDLHAKLGLFWDQIWTLVPFGTKSQIWDFIRAPGYPHPPHQHHHRCLGTGGCQPAFLAETRCKNQLGQCYWFHLILDNIASLYPLPLSYSSARKFLRTDVNWGRNRKSPILGILVRRAPKTNFQ